MNLSDAELKTLVGEIKKYMSKPVEEFDWTVQLGAGTCLEMNWVDHGKFMMGSPTTEDGHVDNEKQHQVELTKGFWLGKYEVTQAQWYAVMGTDPSYFKGSQRPVEQVGYNDALAFCNRLTEKEKAEGRLPEGYKYTLPTEAQWEYACRAGTETALCNGDATAVNMNEVGWYGNGNGGGGNAGGATHIVGQKKANAWGFYDMHGNVWEWCKDWYGEYLFTDQDTAEKDPTGPDTGSNRVIRGGSWYNYATVCRSAQRHGHNSKDEGRVIGFRLALVPVE